MLDTSSNPYLTNHSVMDLRDFDDTEQTIEGTTLVTCIPGMVSAKIIILVECV
jgi:hypothetical protein